VTRSDDRPILTPVPRRNKAVAVGAISYYMEHFITGRISRFTYGALYDVIYQPHNPEHVKRKDMSYLGPSGNKLVPGCFRTMLARVRPPPFSHRPSIHVSLRYRVPRFNKTGKSDSTHVMWLETPQNDGHPYQLSNTLALKTPLSGWTQNQVACLVQTTSYKVLKSSRQV